MSHVGGGDRIVYRTTTRDRDDFDDSRSVISRSGPRDSGAYTTRKVYRIPAEDQIDRFSAYGSNQDRDRIETRIARRERTPEAQVERRVIRIEHREPEPEPEPEPGPRRYQTEYRYEPHRRDDLERYSRSVEYFSRPDPPQPIIIRQEPQQIIIQEALRPPVVISPPPPQEEDFQVIRREEVVRSEVGHRSDTQRSQAGTERQIARRPKPNEDEEEEDYYYERRVRQVARDDEEGHRRRHRERDVSPGDSISQHGRDRGRYDSDSSYEYVRKEIRDDFSDDEHHHRRHLAEGAAVGLGAAELLRHHRKKQDGEEGSRHGRVGRDVGAAALGAIGAEAVTRARSRYREKSKSRRGSRDRGSRDRGSREREGRHKHRRDKSRGKSRSRSSSNRRVKQLAGLGLGAAAVAAAVSYARKNANKEAQERRSRSRTRKHSDGALTEDTDDARNPAHMNSNMAKAGLAGAAVAGLVERARSKSRGGKERSKSRIRQGIPIAAASLGSAAIAGLYEKKQQGKKEKEAKREAKAERAARRERNASRSRSRSRAAYEDSREALPPGHPDLIEYGGGPVYNPAGYHDSYQRPPSQQGYYNNTEDAMVPAAAAGAAYGAQGQKDRERQRSESESDGERRRRRHRRRKSGSPSRSRSRGLATAAVAAGATGLAVSEHEKRKQRRKEEKRERRRKSCIAKFIRGSTQDLTVP